MSNYYTQMCDILPVSKEHVSFVNDYAQAYIEETLDEFWQEHAGKKWKDWRKNEHDVEEFGYGLPDFVWSDYHNAVVMFSEEWLDLDQTAVFIQQVLRWFDIDEVVEMNWAHTSDKIRPGETGGGWMLVSRLEIFYYPYHALIDNKERMREDLKRKTKQLELRLD